MTHELAKFAAAELASREKHYPSMIAAGGINREAADADLAAWRAIAGMTLLEADRQPGTYRHNPRLQVAPDVSWTALEAATSRALRGQRERAGGSPRCAAVQALHDYVVDRRWFWDGGTGPRPTSPAEPLSEAA